MRMSPADVANELIAAKNIKAHHLLAMHKKAAAESKAPNPALDKFNMAYNQASSQTQHEFHKKSAAKEEVGEPASGPAEEMNE